MAELAQLIPDFDFDETTFTVGSNTVQLLQPDPTRWGVIFGNPVTGTTSRVSTRSALGNTTGFIAPAGGIPISLNFRDNGPLPCQAWYGRGVNPTDAVTVIEILYRPPGWQDAGPELLEELSARYARGGVST